MDNWTVERDMEVIRILTDYENIPKDRRYYYVRQHYELIELGGLRRVLRKRDKKLMATVDSFESIIRDVHIAIGHKGQTKTHKKIQETYSNIPMSKVKHFISSCERCAEKAKKKSVRGVVVRPILNERGQVDLVDMRTLPDGEYKWILHYEEHRTKFSILRPLTQKRAVDVALELMAIFMSFRVPHILQTNNGREFTGNVIAELASLWPEAVLVNGCPVERANGTMMDALVAWMRGNNTTRWASGLPFVQWGMNNTFHVAVKLTPYEAVFGKKGRMGLATSVPREFLAKITPGMTEEEYEELLKEDNPASAPPSVAASTLLWENSSSEVPTAADAINPTRSPLIIQMPKVESAGWNDVELNKNHGTVQLDDNSAVLEEVTDLDALEDPSETERPERKCKVDDSDFPEPTAVHRVTQVGPATIKIEMKLRITKTL